MRVCGCLLQDSDNVNTGAPQTNCDACNGAVNDIAARKRVAAAVALS